MRKPSNAQGLIRELHVLLIERLVVCRSEVQFNVISPSNRVSTSLNFLIKWVRQNSWFYSCDWCMKCGYTVWLCLLSPHTTVKLCSGHGFRIRWEESHRARIPTFTRHIMSRIPNDRIGNKCLVFMKRPFSRRHKSFPGGSTLKTVVNEWRSANLRLTAEHWENVDCLKSTELRQFVLISQWLMNVTKIFHWLLRFYLYIMQLQMAWTPCNVYKTWGATLCSPKRRDFWRTAEGVQRA